MKEVFSIEQAAEIIGIPRRSFYHYVNAGLIPVERVTPKRSVMLHEQVKHVKNVLYKYGRKGLRRGLAVMS